MQSHPGRSSWQQKMCCFQLLCIKLSHGGKQLSQEDVPRESTRVNFDGKGESMLSLDQGFSDVALVKSEFYQCCPCSPGAG